jgi:predicted NAD/FAD-dependent oxidoreductase
MRRRKFVKQLGTLVPATFMLPSFLQATLAPKLTAGNVVVIGSGAAGLYAAKVLKEAGVNVIILEAAATHGGRVRPLPGFADFNVEAGAEFVHGKGNTAGDPPSFLWSSINDYNADLLLEYGEFKELYQIGAGYEVDPYWNADLEAAWQFYLNMYAYTGEDVLMSDYLFSEYGIDESHPYWHVYEAWIGSEFGTTVKRIGMKSIAISEVLWLTGGKDFLLDDSYLNILDTLFFNPVLSDIQYNKQVTGIDYAGANTIVTCADGSSYITDKVIVTVPLPILKENLIAFTPALPAEKLSAIDALQMGAGMKLILKFTNNFWGDEIQDMTMDGYTTFIWAPGKGKTGATDNVLICFIMGENAEYMSALNEGAVDVALAELDALFDGAATANFADSFISDFGKDPFVKGAYSFPAPNTYFTETDTTRIDLGLPVDCKLFFAGEATNNNHPSTVHGALESGARAAAEVLECFTLPIYDNVVTDNINMYVFNNNAYFTINTPVIATSVLSLHSIDGKKIQQFYYGRIPSGENEFQFEIGSIANGLYILSADINGKKHQVKVEILN